MNDIENPVLKEVVTNENPMKEWLINYVGETQKPPDGCVTVEMIVDTMTKEFPEFLMALAEENWIRGYQQAIADVEEGEKLIREELQTRVSKPKPKRKKGKKK